MGLVQFHIFCKLYSVLVLASEIASFVWLYDIGFYYLKPINGCFYLRSCSPGFSEKLKLFGVCGSLKLLIFFVALLRLLQPNKPLV